MDAFTEAVEALERAREAKLAELQAIERALQEMSAPGTGTKTPTRWEFQHIGTTEAAKRLIREFGPMDTRRLADAMLDRGLKTRSKNFIATVYATLEQNKKSFRRTEDGNWELIEPLQNSNLPGV